MTLKPKAASSGYRTRIRSTCCDFTTDEFAAVGAQMRVRFPSKTAIQPIVDRHWTVFAHVCKIYRVTTSPRGLSLHHADDPGNLLDAWYSSSLMAFSSGTAARTVSTASRAAPPLSPLPLPAPRDCRSTARGYLRLSVA